MEFSTQNLAPEKIKTAVLAVGVYTGGQLTPAAQAIDAASQGAVRAVLDGEFKAGRGSVLVLRQLAGVAAARVLLVGLGKADELTPRHYAALLAASSARLASFGNKDAATALAEVEVPNLSLQQRAAQVAIAAVCAAYRYETTFGKRDQDGVALAKVAVLASRATATQIQAGLAEGRAIGNGMNAARELGNLPGNVCTPTYLGEAARKAGADNGFKVEVLERKQIEALKMGAFLSVAKGSDEPPRFIVMRYEGAKPAGKRAKGAAAEAAAPYVLVGKGVTFDSGGISIKPAATMDEMKFDMCGAASVVGALTAVAQLKLPINVVGLIPATENLPSGRANKPGDVVTSMSGQTIEVLNTDAEGRLLLCDALTYAERFAPASVIDIATLTGACVVALGHVNTGLFSTDDGLADELLAASRAAVDPTWRMPIEDEYQPQLKSPFADIANIGGPPAGAVTAACFLSRFTRKYKWAHLDIAGTAWKGGKEKGATGRPVPLLVNYLLAQTGKAGKKA
ncbi:leucyl aminopeptidase [Verticiella sediminum]|uniref:Probable cytosol aminopeptidase n=1 Tax=Verticiella sediminum TaxID=1247510 RepID=A0A556A926_9BURK|nr:leucyl aminopeptidase [Verticiella sediminum]TSH89382.1 leucyl aminopeptidase [Verticiella sediminum]